MPTKIGKGGHGQEDYDPNTGEYSEGSSIRKVGGKYQVNKDGKWIDIDEATFKKLKSLGVKEDFDNDEIELTTEDESIINDDGEQFDNEELILEDIPADGRLVDALNNVGTNSFLQSIDDLLGEKSTNNVPQIFADLINNQPIYNKDIYETVLKRIPKLKSLTFKKEGAYFSPLENRINLDIPGGSTFSEYEKHYYIGSIYHEVTHAIDYSYFKEVEYGGTTRKVHASYIDTFISPTHNATFSDTFKSEMEAIPMKELRTIVNEARNRLQEIKKLPWFSAYDAKWAFSDKYSRILDNIRSVYGTKISMPQGCMIHSNQYFEGRTIGLETLAEITEDLMTNKDSNFIKFMKKYCPKTMDIYYEIMNDYLRRE